MNVFLAIGERLRIIKAFVYEPLCVAFIHEWNEENVDDKLHQETYEITQELCYCKDCGYRISHYNIGVPKRLCLNCLKKRD